MLVVNKGTGPRLDKNVTWKFENPDISVFETSTESIFGKASIVFLS
jgi:hypothetical protein